MSHSDEFISDVSIAAAKTLMPGIERLDLPEVTGPEATEYAFGQRNWPTPTHLTFEPHQATGFLAWIDLATVAVVHARVFGEWQPVEMELHSHGIGSCNGRVYEGFTAMFRTADGRYVGRLGFGRYMEPA